MSFTVEKNSLYAHSVYQSNNNKRRKFTSGRKKTTGHINDELIILMAD